MAKQRWILPGLLLCAALAFAASIISAAGQQAAVVPAPAAMPADAATLVNPVKATPESLAKAKKLYGFDCAMCHGANGNGKGDLVDDMKLKLKDWTDPAALKDMPDGELFYVIKNGKGQMPGKADRAKTDELWNMVLLVRGFAKK